MTSLLMSKTKMFLSSTLIVLIGCSWQIIRGDSLTCSCKDSSGCLGNNSCLPSPTECKLENVAFGKTASMSSQYSGGDGTSGPACMAVNGNRSHTIVFNDPGRNCIHTAVSENTPWWSVDLGTSFTITSVTIYNRDGSSDRLNGVTLYVDQQQCDTVKNGNQLVVNVTCSPPVRGQNVILRKNTNLLQFCELEVWVCSAGRYGQTCDELCNGNCKNNETCDNYSGKCWSGCKDGLYGAICNQTCGHCRNITCDQTSGTCPSGCLEGWKGEFCNTSCSPGSYGPGCTQSCGECKDGNTTCNITTGVCENGCHTGYVAPYCNQTCRKGYYGDDCIYTCGNCTAGSTCNFETGVCPSGCDSGFLRPFCNETCVQGFYGTDCNNTCGQCVDRNTCEPATGVCSSGCLAGYQPPYCNETCSGGYYGINCSLPCGKCADNTTCDHVNGTCNKGCQGSLQPPYCSEKCNKGYYGNNCNHTCAKCAGPDTCDPNNGDCPSGCQSGYQGPACDEKCAAGFYGDQCNHTCGKCAAASTCEHDTGLCLGECQSGYQGDRCDSLKEGDGGGSPAVAGGIAAAVILPLIVIAVVVFFVIRHKRRSGRKPEAGAAPHEEPIRNKNDYSSLSPSTAADKNKPSALVKPIVKKAPAHDKHSTHNVSDNIYMNVTSQPAADVTDEPVEYGEADDNLYTNDNLYATYRASGPLLDSVQRTLVDLLASDELPGQFKDLPKGLTDTHEAAKLQANIKKNRYTSVVPYDYNRVILNDDYTEGTATDYVNASYITGFNQEKKYIATQGPRDHTIDDFWRMVWQENVTQIVMLTNTIEGGQNKCAEYWPAPDTTVTYGPVTVVGVDVQRRANFIVRTFVIKTNHNQEEREVEQYHFLAWPDHGVPTTTSLLNFWRFARSRAPHTPPPPVLVHCTAGVGRTGTYIGLDIAFEEAVARAKVNVLDVVLKMRKERCIMVQTLAQYVFLHKVLLEAYTGRNTTFPIHQFETTHPGPISAHKTNSVIDSEFQRIMQMRSLTPELTYKGAREKENAEKNRSLDALPCDEHRVYLTARVPGRNQYINAVFMSEYLSNQGNILTQLPLPGTLVDFWRLVDGNDVTTIVSLGSEKEAELKDFCQYWPVHRKSSVHCEPYVVSLKSSSQLGSHLVLYELTLEKKGSQDKRDVSLVRFEDWCEELPGNTSLLLTLISFVDSRRQMDGNSSPIIIQCLDGVAKSGVFCALCDVISRLTRDKDVDVYMTVRELHTVRPQALTSVVQYRYLYQVAQHWLCDMNVYTNTS
ncbi:receptor-type tyrosine-protein phosphatase kappa-like isoform X3 [Pomacea canaliculata]|uniref:receptor-type tyrosine-protein phosphatase kappa-like isoform X3 n=1 Tax=Pomacea canaliculata TaxID=400727 RepID=UPI000D72E2AE|nr:receptor-type tyrosine-protein phosphatase kappa-like isoform X3 [Pomacea canaliculata]